MSTANALSQFQNYMAMQKPWQGASNPGGVKASVPAQTPVAQQPIQNPNGFKVTVPTRTSAPQQPFQSPSGNWNQQGAIGQAVPTMPQQPVIGPQAPPMSQAPQTPTPVVGPQAAPPQTNHRYVENAPPPSQMQNAAMQKVSALPPDSRAKFQEILMQRMKQMQDQQNILRNRK